MKTNEVSSAVPHYRLWPTVLRQRLKAKSWSSLEPAWSRAAPRLALSAVPSLCLASLLASGADGIPANSSAAAAQAPGPSSALFERPANPPPVAGQTGNTQPGTNVAVTFLGRNMDALDDKQKLAVGDRVSFRVVEDQEDPKPLTITDAGELDVPELGLVPAAGKTCKQLAFEIKPKLEASTYYHATVVIGIDLLNKTMSGRRVYVGGQVIRPGPQEIPAGETWTVTKAIMRAGGFTQYANKKGVRLVRAATNGTPGTTLILNAAEVWEKGRTDLDLSVQPEDLIYVPTRALNILD